MKMHILAHRRHRHVKKEVKLWYNEHKSVINKLNCQQAKLFKNLLPLKFDKKDYDEKRLERLAGEKERMENLQKTIKGIYTCKPKPRQVSISSLLPNKGVLSLRRRSLPKSLWQYHMGLQKDSSISMTSNIDSIEEFADSDGKMYTRSVYGVPIDIPAPSSKHSQLEVPGAHNEIENTKYNTIFDEDMNEKKPNSEYIKKKRVSIKDVNDTNKSTAFLEDIKCINDSVNKIPLKKHNEIKADDVHIPSSTRQGLKQNRLSPQFLPMVSESKSFSTISPSESVLNLSSKESVLPRIPNIETALIARPARRSIDGKDNLVELKTHTGVVMSKFPLPSSQSTSFHDSIIDGSLTELQALNCINSREEFKYKYINKDSEHIVKHKPLTLAQRNQKRHSDFEKERKEILNRESPKLYKKDAAGQIVEAGYPFKRLQFNRPPSRELKKYKQLLDKYRADKKEAQDKVLEYLNHLTDTELQGLDKHARIQMGQRGKNLISQAMDRGNLLPSLMDAIEKGVRLPDCTESSCTSVHRQWPFLRELRKSMKIEAEDNLDAISTSTLHRNSEKSLPQISKQRSITGRHAHYS